MEHFHNLKVSPHKNLTDYKRKKKNSTLEKPGRQHFNQMIKINAIRNEINCNVVSCERVQ